MALLFLSSFVLSILLNILFLKLFKRFKIPISKGKRPSIGGAAFCISSIVTYFIFTALKGAALPPQLAWILIFSFAIFVMGIFDDIRDHSLRSRVVIQVVFIVLFLFPAKRIQFFFLPHYMNYALSFLWIMGITNAFNLIDIGDGLCGGVSLIVAASFLTVLLVKQDILLAGIFAGLLGGIAAFMVFNFPPAKVFMGNSGSHFLGFLFASLSIYGDYATVDNPVELALPLLILAFPIIDTAFLTAARAKKGIVPLMKSDDHIFLRLVSSGWSIRKTLLNIYVISLLWALSGISLLAESGPLFMATLAIASLYTTGIILKSVSTRGRPAPASATRRTPLPGRKN